MKKRLKILYITMLVLGVIFVILGALFRFYGLIPVGGFMVVKYSNDIYRNK